MAEGWSWRDRDPSRHAGLRYEPGNWGDALKGEWALIAVEALLARGAVRVLDPFAGAPRYPLSPASAARLAALPSECARYPAAQAPHVAAQQLASTATLLGERGATLHVFDADDARRGAWTGVRVLDQTDGAAALRAARGADYELVHVDPYDLQSEWGTLLPPALEALAPAGVLLAYLFNKAPRGGGHVEQYASLRKGLEGRLRPDQRLLVGRVPADPVLPRAHHELLLVAPAALAAALEPALRETARALAASVAADGAFEAWEADP